MDVLLITMPFGPLATPSLGLSILAAQLKALRISVKVEYFNIRFAQLLGEREYQYFCDGYPATHALFAEWVFSRLLNSQDNTTDYLEEVLIPELTEGHWSTGNTPFTQQEIIGLIDRVEDVSALFFDECLKSILKNKPKIVGFTSTFQQHISSLLLARMIKESSPATIVVLGGANCEGEMGAETLRCYPFVDAIVQGEGESSFPLFVQSVMSGLPNYNLKNIISRKHNNELPTSVDPSSKTSQFVDLNEIPYPDYDDFVLAWNSRDVGLDSPVHATLLFETARGCWWGQKNHCTFCGLNGEGMAFRSKDPIRALDELKYLIEKYNNSRITVVDNILDMKYFTTFIPMLQNSGLKIDLFWEVKANLKYEHLKQLKCAGITFIQPGIESFSNQVLKLMNKGVSAIQNIQFLKWCSELDMYAAWNILYGFPQESPEEYVRQAELIPKICHFQPPTGYFSIRLDRYSPNFNQSEAHGFFDVSPMPAYNYVYSELKPDQVYNMAYFFKHRDSNSNKVNSYTKDLRRELRWWKTRAEQALLLHIDNDSEITIIDTRPKYITKSIRKLQHLDAMLYRACNSVQSLSSIYTDSRFSEFSKPEITDSLKNLLDWGYVIEIEEKHLSLGIDIHQKNLSDKEIFSLQQVFPKELKS